MSGGGARAIAIVQPARGADRSSIGPPARAEVGHAFGREHPRARCSRAELALNSC